jgi:large conductance mechanosensitive channel
MLKGFKAFIARGNVIDLAVAVIIGAAFGSIVDSLVKDIITPIIGMFGGQPDLSALKLGAIGVGSFLNAMISFIIKAAGVYLLIVVPFNRFASRLAPVSGPPRQEMLLSDIRDLLQQEAARSRASDGPPR